MKSTKNIRTRKINGLFNAGGMDFLVFNFGYEERPDDILSWADDVLKNYPDHRVIVVSHYLLLESSRHTLWGREVYKHFKDNTNLFLMLTGCIGLRIGEMMVGARNLAETDDEERGWVKYFEEAVMRIAEEDGLDGEEMLKGAVSGDPGVFSGIIASTRLSLRAARCATPRPPLA